MAMSTENTAAVSAMGMPERKQLESLILRLMHYKVSITVLRSLLDDADYEKCCHILANKYGLSLCSIFR
jgi:hypothetical protein